MIIFCSFSYAKELTFMGMPFGTSADDVIKTMKNNGWSVKSDTIRDFQIRSISFTKVNGTYANMPCNEIYISFFKYALTNTHEMAKIRIIVSTDDIDKDLGNYFNTLNQVYGLDYCNVDSEKSVDLQDKSYYISVSPYKETYFYIDIITQEFKELDDAINKAIEILNTIHYIRFINEKNMSNM